MKGSYLEITFRHGQPIAAYLYLPRNAGETSQRVEMAKPGIIIDFGSSDKPIGIEITAPTLTTVADLNAVLVSLGLLPMQDKELAPLRAAA